MEREAHEHRHNPWRWPGMVSGTLLLSFWNPRSEFLDSGGEKLLWVETPRNCLESSFGFRGIWLICSQSCEMSLMPLNLTRAPNKAITISIHICSPKQKKLQHESCGKRRDWSTRERKFQTLHRVRWIWYNSSKNSANFSPKLRSYISRNSKLITGMEPNRERTHISCVNYFWNHFK